MIITTNNNNDVNLQNMNNVNNSDVRKEVNIGSAVPRHHRRSSVASNDSSTTDGSLSLQSFSLSESSVISSRKEIVDETSDSSSTASSSSSDCWSSESSTTKFGKFSTSSSRKQGNRKGSSNTTDKKEKGHQKFCNKYNTKNRGSRGGGGGDSNGGDDISSSSYQHSYKKPNLPLRTQYVAMDCEMVVSVTGITMCARVVLTNWKGKVVFDSYVKPTEDVGDYRTYISGVNSTNLVNAPSLELVREQVIDIIHDKILVGHGLENDLSSLYINDHPWYMIRDTAYYPPFMRIMYNTIDGVQYYTPRKLKDLCMDKLQREIQLLGKAHSPTEDANAALDLYKSHRPRWETCIAAQMRMEKKQQKRQASCGRKQKGYCY